MRQRQEVRDRIRQMLEVAAKAVATSQSMVHEGARMMVDAKGAVDHANGHVRRAANRYRRLRGR